MKVYCTRPRQLDEAPHLTEIPIDDLSEYHQCDVCKMPLIFANRYVPIAELGRGGFGYTFKAVDLNFRAEDGNYSYRTIKQFRTEQLLLPNQIERARIAFKEECNILDRLEHPQIPRVYHPFEIASPIYLRSTIRQEPSIYYYFVQKYIEGHDLKDRLFSESDVISFLRQMLPVLKYIHTRSIPIIHCDIKPSNIIQSGHDRTYHLIDFGAFKRIIAETTAGSSQAETIFTTTGFSPPEQYEGRVNFSSDIYALGKTCICLLSGNPFQLPIIENLHLDRILRQMTEINTQQRYQSVVEIQTELDSLQILINYPYLFNISLTETLNIPLTEILQITAESPQQLHQSVMEIETEPDLPQIPITDPTFTVLLATQKGISWLKILVIGVCLIILSIGVNQIIKVLFPPLAVFNPPKIENLSGVQSFPTGIFSYGGSKTWTPLSQSINPIIHQSFRTFQLKYQSPPNGIRPNSETGIEMLIQGHVDIALSSKPISDRLAKGVDGVRLLSTVVAKSSSAVIVNPSLKIDGLTTTEFGLIKEGKITNWQEVRGPNLPIKIYTSDANFSTGAKVELVSNPTVTFQKVAEDPGGLTIAPSNLAALQCTIKILPIGVNSTNLVSPYIQPLVSKTDCLNGRRNRVNIDVIKNLNYPLVADLRVFIRADDSVKRKVGEAYITMLMTKEGQRRIKDTGYLPIRE